MKAIINGKRYDTSKAILVGEASSTGYSRSDFSFWEAALYRTPKSGAFFLAGEGGAMTQFAHHVANGRTFGDGIFPMTKADALEWAERYLTQDKIEEHFADTIEDA